MTVPPITEAVGRVKRVLHVSLTPFATGLKETLALVFEARSRTRSWTFRSKIN